MCQLPEGYEEIQKPQTAHGPAHPARSYHRSQALQAYLLRGVEQEEIVAPIAKAERRQKRQDVYPRQEGQHNAYFQTQDDVEDNCQSRGHT